MGSNASFLIGQIIMFRLFIRISRFSARVYNRKAAANVMELHIIRTVLKNFTLKI